METKLTKTEYDFLNEVAPECIKQTTKVKADIPIFKVAITSLGDILRRFMNKDITVLEIKVNEQDKIVDAIKEVKGEYHIFQQDGKLYLRVLFKNQSEAIFFGQKLTFIHIQSVIK